MQRPKSTAPFTGVELFFSKMTQDLRSKICNDYFGKAEIRALAISSSGMNTLFDNNSVWSRLLNRDFKCNLSVASAKEAYRVMPAEQSRLVAYVQILLNPVSEDMLGEHKKSKSDTNREVRIDLHHHLKTRNYDEFTKRAAAYLSQARFVKLDEEKDRLMQIYRSIFATPVEVSGNHVYDYLDMQESRLRSSHFSDTRKVQCIFRSLVKCGAFYSLSILLSKLGSYVDESSSTNLKKRFLDHVGSSLLCDAITCQRPDMVSLLLSHGVSATSPSFDGELMEGVQLLPMECAVKSLHRFYQHMSGLGSFASHQDTFNNITRCIALLCEAHADLDQIGQSISPRYQKYINTIYDTHVEASPSTTIKDYILQILNEVRKDRDLAHSDIKTLCQLLEMVIEPRPVIDADIVDEPAVTDPMLIDDGFDDDFSSSSEGEEQESPKKKSRTEEPDTPSKVAAAGFSQMSLRGHYPH